MTRIQSQQERIKRLSVFGRQKIVAKIRFFSSHDTTPCLLLLHSSKNTHTYTHTRTCIRAHAYTA